jgi:hypothetical protein
MNPKLTKTNAEIERTKVKIAELQLRLPVLEETREQLENDEVIKVFRQVSVKPGEFADFIRAYRAYKPCGFEAVNINNSKEEPNAQNNNINGGGTGNVDAVYNNDSVGGE